MSIQDTDIIRDRTVQLGTAPAMRGPRSGGNDFMSSLSEAVRDNPVSAALIGMGALWLFTGGSTMSLLGGRGRKSILGTAAHGAESLAQGAGGFAHDAARSAGRMGSSIASGISSTVGGLAGSVSDTAGRVGDYVSQGLHGVDAQAEYRNPNFTSPGGSFRSTVSGMTSDVAGSLHDMFDRHPVALGAAGLPSAPPSRPRCRSPPPNARRSARPTRRCAASSARPRSRRRTWPPPPSRK